MTDSPVVDGPRACAADEFDGVVALLNRVFREGSDQNTQTDYPLIFDPARREYMRVVSIDGAVVAHVPVAPRGVVIDGDSFTLAIIGGTVTHPDHRHRGYATACLRDGVRIMVERGWPVSALWTIEPTFPFYRNSGWEAVGSQGWMYPLDADDVARMRPSRHRIAVYEPGNSGHLSAIRGIHDREPLRIARSPDEYDVLFSLPKMHTLLAFEDDDVAAYLTVGQGTNKPGLVEGGGDHRALEALVRHARAEWPADQDLQVVLPLTPCALGKVVSAIKPGQQRPVEQASGIGFQMMRVNDFGLLMRQVRNHLGRRSAGIRGEACVVSEDTNEAVSLRVRDGEVEVMSERLPDAVALSRRQLTQLVFGGHPSAPPLDLHGSGAHLLDALFPIYAPIWEIDHS
ncbi:MAG: GNAT family N-acetyltransferase [Chloroflexi bacterium]|nr:GNAT family N-acetyltransferase [Chloroflexota bacterium]